MITFTSIKMLDTFSLTNQAFQFKSGMHSVSGLNGSSKTSLFLALQQGLFNRNSKNCKVSDVSNSITGQPYEIEVAFTKNEDFYRVVNSRKTGKIDLFKNGRNIALRKIPEVLAQIKEILGCDYDLFRDLTYQSKDSTLNLLDSSSNAGRAQFVNDILKLDELDAKLTQLNDKRKALEGKNGRVAALQESIDSLEVALTPLVEVPDEVEFDSSILQTVEQERRDLTDRLAELKAQLKTEETYITAYVAQNEKLSQIEALQAELAVIKQFDSEQVGDEIDALNDQISDVKDTTYHIQAQLAEANKSSQQIRRRDELDAQLKEIAVPDKPLEECLDQKSKIEKALATKSEQLRSNEESLKKLVKASSIGVCPTCTSVVDPTHFTEPINSLKSEISGISGFIQKCNDSLVKYRDRISVWNTINEINREKETISGISVYSTEDVERLATGLRTAQTSLELLQNKRKDLSEWFKLYDKNQTVNHKIEVLEAEIRSVEQPDIVKVDALREQIRVVSGEVQAVELKLVDLTKGVAKLQQHNAECRAKRAMNEQVTLSNTHVQLTIDQKRKELTEAQEKVDLLKQWINVLGPKGYRTTKISKFLAALNLTMKRYAELMSNGRILCQFLLSPAGEITFEITDEAKTQDISLWSGGETARIKIVCLFAVLEIMEAMGSTSFNVICLDEIFSALDQEGKEGLFKVLEYLKQRNKAIYVIAHEELALDLMYDSVVKAEKLSDGTTRIIQ